MFEIDQPQVIEFKAATHRRARRRARPPTCAPLPIDLRHDWPSALRQAGFDTERPAAWAAEGLLGFLPPEAQDRLLDNITALSADGSRLVAEIFLGSDAGTSRPLNAAAEKWQQQRPRHRPG